MNTEFPAAWRTVRLSEICNIVGGSTPSSGIAEFWDGEIVWITPTDLGRLNRNQDILTSARKISEAGYRSCGTGMVPCGSVVMSSRAPIGHLGIARVALCTNQGCKSFVPKNGLDSEFLFFRLREMTPEIRALGSGSTFTEISKTRLANLEISLPSIDEQRRIAALLREELSILAEARAALKAQLAAAESLPAAHLRAVFESEDMQQWPLRRLGDLLVLRQDIVHPRNKPSGAAKFVGLEHIESHSGRRIGELPIQMEQMTGRKARFFTGDIVYGYLRPYLNKVWIAEFEGLCSVDQYVFEVKRDVADTNFIAWFMRSSTYLSRAPVKETPGWLPRIRTDEVAAVEINLPPVETQHVIAEKLDWAFAEAQTLRRTLKTKLSELEKVPAALLRAAFSPVARVD